jgi:hypothetical protein
MTQAPPDKDRVVELHRFAIILFVVLAVARLGYIAACPTPLRENFGHLALTVPALAIGAYYTFIRFHPIIAALFNGFGLLGIGFTGSILASILTVYTGRQFPFTDQALAAADHFIGFDWLTWLKAFERFPQFDAILRSAYQSINAQIILIILVLAFTRQLERLYRFLAATNIALVTTCIVSVFFPALGPYELLGLTAADHPHIDLISAARTTDAILWLRTATFADPVPSFALGLIWFPSFHAAAAAIYIWATWRTPIIRWISIALNALMLIATPIHGSHYMVDVFAGLAVAAAAVAVTTWMFSRIGNRRQPALSTAESAA